MKPERKRRVREFFASALQALEKAFRTLEARVPPPVQVPWKNSFVFRYKERSLEQAIVQKLARTISGLYAINTLLLHGLFQEQGAIQRILDELEEDIIFLSYALVRDELTQRHNDYLNYFYAEEFVDPDDVVGSHASRGTVGREKIRAYINQVSGLEPSRGNVVEKVLAKSYSGFVHAASPHVMDMCGGWPPRFDLNGELAWRRGDVHWRDAMNYFLRGMFAMAFAAKALGDEELFEEMRATSRKFEDEMQRA
jgi:hypothetical protein